MAKKKKRNGVKVTKQEKQSRLHNGSEAKKFVPMARNLLLLDLIFLAIVQWMVQGEKMTEDVANWMTLVGLILFLTALYIQFVKSNKKNDTITK